MYDGALIDGVVRIDYLRAGEAKEGVGGNEHNTNGVVMDRASPLKIVIGCYREGGSDISFPEGGKGSIVRLVDEG